VRSSPAAPNKDAEVSRCLVFIADPGGKSYNGGSHPVPLTHVARGVYTVTLPAAATKADFEYYVQAEHRVATLLDGSHLFSHMKFPPTAPAINQTVVVAGDK
jgi:hypothetical protein